MREPQFRRVQKRPQVTPPFLRRLYRQRLIERLFDADQVVADRDSDEGFVGLFNFLRNNPESAEAVAIRDFLNVFCRDAAETEEASEQEASVSDKVVHDLMDYSRATRILTVSFIDEAACQIEGGVPHISPTYNDGYDGAVDEILASDFRKAADEGHPQAKDRLSLHEAFVWSRGAANRARVEVEAEIVRMDRHRKDQFAARKLG